MPNTPYPPYPPNVPVVEETGGFNRTCLVIDLCTVERLTSAQLAQIEDQVGLVLDRIKDIYKADVVRADRFIPSLKAALRLK
jgi:hypothetical protein